MSDLNNIGTDVKLGGQSYRIYLTVRAVDLIQDQFDINIKDFARVIGKTNTTAVLNMAYILTILLNEQIKIARDDGSTEPFFTINQVEKMITPDNVIDLLMALIQAYRLSFKERDEEDISVGEKEEKFNVIRLLTIGRVLGYSERETWLMAPKRLQILHDDYLDYHGRKRKPVTIDDVIPI